MKFMFSNVKKSKCLSDFRVTVYSGQNHEARSFPLAFVLVRKANFLCLGSK